MTDVPWRRAWRTARAKQAADAPRQAAVRDAMDAVRAQNLSSDADARAALAIELQQRDVTVEPDSFGLLARAARTSPLGATVIVGREVFVRIRATVGLLRSLADPRWTQTPNGIPDLGEWRDDQDEVGAPVTWDDAGRAVVERLFADVREQQDEDDRPVRLFACWLSLDADKIRVHVGKERVGTIDAPSARTVIAHHGGHRRGVGTFAELHGTSADDATLTVYLPDRP